MFPRAAFELFLVISVTPVRREIVWERLLPIAELEAETTLKLLAKSPDETEKLFDFLLDSESLLLN